MSKHNSKYHLNSQILAEYLNTAEKAIKYSKSNIRSQYMTQFHTNLTTSSSLLKVTVTLLH